MHWPNRKEVKKYGYVEPRLQPPTKVPIANVADAKMKHVKSSSTRHPNEGGQRPGMLVMSIKCCLVQVSLPS